MQIGHATAAEVAPVKAAGWRDTYSRWVAPDVLAPFVDPERVAAALARDLEHEANFALAAREHGTVVGIATVLAADRAEPLLDSLHVLPERRGARLGEALVRAVAAECARRGARALTVEVLEPNVRACRFYERLGAALAGTAAPTWTQGVPEVVYRWDDLPALAADAAGDPARPG